jgi:hypothetical protein
MSVAVARRGKCWTFLIFCVAIQEASNESPHIIVGTWTVVAVLIVGLIATLLATSLIGGVL